MEVQYIYESLYDSDSVASSLVLSMDSSKTVLGNTAVAECALMEALMPPSQTKSSCFLGCRVVRVTHQIKQNFNAHGNSNRFPTNLFAYQCH
jgi:hypothetical protein